MRTIPDRCQHWTRYYGAYSNRTRQALFRNNGSRSSPSHPEQDTNTVSTTSLPSRASWARLIRKVFEVDPLRCPTGGSEMKIIAVLTDPKVVDRIIRHLDKNVGAARSPPPTSGFLHPTLTAHDNL